MKIVIVDYGMGNIKSIKSTLEYIGVTDIEISDKADVLFNADRIILPGVGSYGKAMKEIKERKLDSYLRQLALIDKKPILGICLGMQLMGISSNEDGLNQGLGFIDATVTRFDDEVLKIPHVGFNQVLISSKLKLFKDFNKDYYDFYFTHSYKMKSNCEINQNYCNYYENFVACYEVDNICGTQFHPELSQKNGLKLLTNFIENF